MKYVCDLCGWVYDEEETGVKWEDLPEDFECELCGVGKDQFTAEEKEKSKVPSLFRDGLSLYKGRGAYQSVIANENGNLCE